MAEAASMDIHAVKLRLGAVVNPNKHLQGCWLRAAPAPLRHQSCWHHRARWPVHLAPLRSPPLPASSCVQAARASQPVCERCAVATRAQASSAESVQMHTAWSAQGGRPQPRRPPWARQCLGPRLASWPAPHVSGGCYCYPLSWQNSLQCTWTHAEINRSRSHEPRAAVTFSGSTQDMVQASRCGLRHTVYHAMLCKAARLLPSRVPKTLQRWLAWQSCRWLGMLHCAC